MSFASVVSKGLNLVIVISFSLIGRCNAQSHALSKQMIDSIRNEGVTFLIQNNYFKKDGDREEYLRQVFYYEIVKHEKLGDSNSGIFVFSITSSHSYGFIFIIDNGKWKHYKLDQMREILSDVNSFVLKNGTSNEAVFEYVDGIVAVYKNNRSLR
jgi:hypothetical protein